MKRPDHPKHHDPKRPEKGSALFIILVGIALFAALSYTVAEIMRSGDVNMITEEKAKLYAGEILEYARNLRQSAQTLKINGCDALDISFENSTVSGYEHSPVADDNCKIFESTGAGMSYIAPSADWLDANSSALDLYGEWHFPAEVCVPDIGTSGSGTGCNSDGVDNEDLIVILPYIREEICLQINEGLDLGSTIPSETDNAWLAADTKFTGTQSDGERLDQDAVSAGCFEGSGVNNPPTGTYHFFQVLSPR